MLQDDALDDDAKFDEHEVLKEMLSGSRTAYLSKKQAEKLKALRKSTRNSLHLRTVLLQDRDTQRLGRMALATADVLHEDMAQSLEAAYTVDGSLTFAGDRATNWWRTCVKLASILKDASLLARFGLTVHDIDLSHLHAVLELEPSAEVWAHETLLATHCFRLVVETIAQEAWTKYRYDILFPHCYAAVFATNKEDAEENMEQNHLRSDALTRLQALERQHPIARSLLCDLDFHDSQLVLELRAVCNLKGWSRANAELRDIAYCCCASAGNTKHALEDVFKDLGHEHKQAASKSGRWSRFSNLIKFTKKSLSKHDTHIVEMEHTDLHAPLIVRNSRSVLHDSGLFTPPPLPRAIHRPVPATPDVGLKSRSCNPAVDLGVLLKRGQSFGANYYVQVAGLALAAHAHETCPEDDDDFTAMLSGSWMLGLIGTCLVYKLGDHQIVLGLGFHKYAAMVHRLATITIDSENFYCLEDGCKPQFMCAIDASIKAIPTEVIPPIRAPPEVRSNGILLRQVGDPEELIPFALKNGVQMNKHLVDALYKSEGARVPKGVKVNKSTELEALVNKIFADESGEFKMDMLDRLINGKKPPGLEGDAVSDSFLGEALDQMDKDDLNHFEDLEIKVKARKRVREVESRHKKDNAKRSKTSKSDRPDETKGDDAEPDVPDAKADDRSASGDEGEDGRAGRIRGPTKHRTSKKYTHLLPGKGKVAGYRMSDDPENNTYIGYCKRAKPHEYCVRAYGRIRPPEEETIVQ
jgi:hypothetical protein